MPPNTGFPLNIKTSLLFLSGLLVTVYGLDFVYQSIAVHQFLVAINPAGRVATLASILFVIMMVVSKYPDRDELFGFSSRNSTAIVLLFFLILWLSFLPALGSWASADPYGYSIGGILQTKDASAYIAGAEQLIETGEFGQWNQRRPLNTTLLSSRMVLAGLDFRNTLLLQAGLFAVPIFFVVLLLWQQFGGAAAALMFLLNFAFAAYYLPTTLSESLGMSLGLMALAFFLLALRLEKRRYYYVGIFVMTLALLTRTGPMFVIPLLVLYAGWLYSDNHKYSIREVLIAVFPVVLAIIFNSSLNFFYADGTSGADGSSHYVLYNIVVGGSHWEQARFDYPEEFKSLNSSAFADLIYARSFEAIISKPLSVISRYFHLLFSDGVRFLYGMYGTFMYLTYPDHALKTLESFLSLSHEQVVQYKERLVSLIGVLFMTAISLGLFRLLRFARKESIVHLSLLGVAASVLSIPLLYSFASVRVFITQIPFMILFLVLTLCAIRQVKNINAVRSNDLLNESRAGSYLISFLFLLLFLALVMPAVSSAIYGRKITDKSSEVKAFTCPASSPEEEVEKTVMWTGPGMSHIEIISDDSSSLTFSPEIRERDFVLGAQHEKRLRNVEMKPGTVIISGYDQLSGRRLYLANAAEILAGKPGYRIICARDNSEKGRFPWFVTAFHEI